MKEVAEDDGNPLHVLVKVESGMRERLSVRAIGHHSPLDYRYYLNTSDETSIIIREDSIRYNTQVMEH